jgi:translocation and assembly module TamB
MARRVLIVALLLFVALPVALIAYFLYTESGLALVAGELDRLARFGVHVEGVRGRIAGPLTIDRLEVDTARVHVLVTGIEATPRLGAAVLQTVAFAHVTVRTVDIELREPEADSPPRGQAPRFLPAWLRVIAEQADIGRTRFAMASGFELEANHARARVEVSQHEIRVTALAIDARDFSLNGAAHLESRRKLEIDVAASGRVTLPERPAVVLIARVSGPVDALQFDSRIEAPAAAHLVGSIETGTDGWQIVGQVESRDPALGAWIENPPVTPRDLAARVQMNSDGIVVNGNVTLPEITAKPLRVEANGRFKDKALEIEQATVAPAGTDMRVGASGRIAFSGAAPEVSGRVGWSGLAWPLDAEPVVASEHGTIAIEGALPYRVDAEATLEVPGQTPAQVALNGTIDKARVQLAEFLVTASAGRVRGSGELAFAAPRDWRATIASEGVDLSPWLAAFPSRIDLVASLAGRGIDQNATFEAHIDSLAGTLRGQPLSGKGLIARTASGWRARDLVLGLGANRAVVTGTLGDRVDAHLKLDAQDLGQVLPDTEGELQLTVAASGRLNEPAIEAQWSAAGLRYAGWTATTLEGRAQIDLSDRSDSELSARATSIAHGDLDIPGIDLKARGTQSAHEITLQGSVENPNLESALIEFSIEADGAYRDRGWSGRLADLVLDIDAANRIELVQPATVAVSTTAARVESLCLRISGADVCSDGSWQADGPWAFEGNLDRVPLTMLGDFLPNRPDYAGTLTATFDARGHGSELIAGHADLSVTDGVVRFEMIGGEQQSVELGSGMIEITADPAAIVGDARLDASEGTFIAVGLRVARTRALAFRDQELSGTLQARSDDTAALSYIVPELDRVGGRVEADFAIFGTLAAPRFDGSLALREGSVELYRFNTVLTDLEFVARLRDRLIEFDGSSQMGEGSLALDGSLAWRQGAPAGSIALRGENLTIADSPELRVRASPDLKFEIEGRSLEMTGKVVIPYARIEPHDLRTAASTSPDARIVGEEIRTEDERGAFDVRSRVEIELGDDVSVDAIGLAGQLAGSLTAMSGYRDVETGRGEIRVVDGKYEAYGQKLDITRGRLLFDGSPLADPGLDIQAEKELPEVTVGLNVRGTLRAPRLSLYSDPTMPQSQILSYLLIGKSLDEASEQDTATVTSANRLAATGGGLITSRLGRQFGLEEVGIETSGADDASLVLGKFLSPRMFVSYGISLTESINTAKLRYTISDSWVLKIEAGEQQSADLEFKIER